MYVRAKNDFNYGGIIKMCAGDKDKIDDELAKKLIALDLVVEHNPKSYKKIKIKKDEPIDKSED